MTEIIISLEMLQDISGKDIKLSKYDEVVTRCKDCKHYYEREWIVGGGSYTTCWYQTIANAQPNDFCSRAERKEE